MQQFLEALDHRRKRGAERPQNWMGDLLKIFLAKVEEFHPPKVIKGRRHCERATPTETIAAPAA